MINRGLLHLKSSFLQGVLLTALVAGAFLVPVAKAAIDDTKPSTIPAEILADWKAQGGDAATIKASLPDDLKAKCGDSFEDACHWRRVARMREFSCLETILFARHHNMGSVAIGFWVNVNSSSNTVSDDKFEKKGAICLLKFENYYSQYKEILTKNDMFVKDPAISLDGKKVVFAMSTGKGQGSLLYEMEIDNPSKVTQLTEKPAGLTVADFEPCYLPNGDITFTSTRCFGVIDCGWQPTSNQFLMDSTGKYMRRIGFDQVHTGYPSLREDGSVLYQRWEYNDRDVSNVMGIFQMYPDGSHQAEVFGNQTTWPMTIIHPRGVPGSPNLFFAVASGHHGSYSGEVFICDISKSSNGPENITMISPPRKTESRNKNDTWAMGGVWRNSEYPYPLDKDWYLVSYRDENKEESFGSISGTPYKIYLKNVDGKSRELLAWGNGSLHHPMPVATFEEIWGSPAPQIATQADYKDSMGTFTMNDVYYGAGMEGIDKASGEAKTLRVVALKYRVAGACDNNFGQVMGSQPAGVVFAAPTICPVSIYGGSWEVKNVLGEAKIYEDGSAAFKVPARTPVYFQVLDKDGRCIANMRSWATLMPGETFACYGCHENKASAPPTAGSFLAGTAGAQKLDTPLGIENQGFDFKKMVQPILDDHCASCHKSGHASGFDLTGGDAYDSQAKKTWTKSYQSLMSGIASKRSNKAINITTIFSQPPQMPPKSYGSTKSGMITNCLNGHKDVKITADEIKILATWIDLEAPFAPDYDEYMSSGDAQKYHGLESTAQKWYDIELQNIKDLSKVAAMPQAQRNVKALVAAAEDLKIGYLPTQRALVLNQVSQGTFMLVDLKGKVISRMKLSHRNIEDVTISLPKSLVTGLYLAKYEGVDGMHKAKVTITR